MCHASGIQTNVPLRPRFFFEQPWYRRSLAEVADAIADTNLIFEPGQRVQYSNAAPYVLGRIIELQSRQPFGDYVREKILNPLGMTDTGFAVPRAKIDRTAVVYRRQNGSLAVYCRYDPKWDVRMTMPDGGLFSTPQDIARFANSFLNDKDTILSKQSVDVMLKEQSDGYGLAWILDAQGQYSHWGSSGTLVWGDQRTNVVGVVFFQIQDQKRVDVIQRRFRDAVTQAMSVTDSNDDKCFIES
jgi:CubicO group peptidase (beta-lactamase class C family)